MLRGDIADARREWLRSAKHDPDEYERRATSDFLVEENQKGERLDFHSLRHTCGAWLAMTGAHRKAVQAVMRHSSITLNMDTYGHLFPGQEAETVARLSDLIGDPLEPLRATGTLDRADSNESDHQQYHQQWAHENMRFGATRRDEEQGNGSELGLCNSLSSADIGNTTPDNARHCDNAPPGIRTPDPLIKSQLLCQLS